MQAGVEAAKDVSEPARAAMQAGVKAAKAQARLGVQ